MRKVALEVDFIVEFPNTHEYEPDSWIKDWIVEQLKDSFDGVTEDDIDFGDEIVSDDLENDICYQWLKKKD